MNIIFFSHPDFLRFQSIPRFTNMLANGMAERGHNVDVWSPEAKFFSLGKSPSIKKWLGYIDQFIVFTFQVRKRLKTCSRDTLFVFTDNAQGPWVPVLSNRFHVIHCHDFLAQHSALNKIPGISTSWTGRQYQKYIRSGFLRGKNFISVSEKTRTDLHNFFSVPPSFSEVVYNGLNQDFEVIDPVNARISLGDQLSIKLSKGYILHVGGNHWYKNRPGVIEIYNQVRKKGSAVSLLMIGEQASDDLLKLYNDSPYKDDIHLLTNIEDKLVRLAYSGAELLLFPSLAEGFGWPIAEAMASGCPVVTTNEAPMTEVAGTAGFFINKMPLDQQKINQWSYDSAEVVQKVLTLTTEARKKVVEDGIQNAKRFNTEDALDRMEAFYLKICQDNKVTKKMALAEH